MKKYILICALLAIANFGEAQDNKELSLMSHKKLLAKTLDRSFHYVYATFKNKKGEPLSDYERQQLNLGKMAMHYYQDSEGVVREVVIKPFTLDDKFEKAALNYQRYFLLESDRLIDVACEESKTIFVSLEEDLDNINQYREELPDTLGWRERYDAVETFKDSLQYDKRVFSILHRCEWEEDKIEFILSIVTRDSQVASFHYFKLKEYYEKGLIPAAKWAGLQDAILVTNGFDQVYGTSVRNNRLSNLENPYNVNSRRMEMDLPTIETFLEDLGLDFEIELHRMSIR